MREGGLEPPCPLGHTDLNRARLPISPLALTISAVTHQPSEIITATGAKSTCPGGERECHLCTLQYQGVYCQLAATGLLDAQVIQR